MLYIGLLIGMFLGIGLGISVMCIFKVAGQSDIEKEQSIQQ